MAHRFKPVVAVRSVHTVRSRIRLQSGRAGNTVFRRKSPMRARDWVSGQSANSASAHCNIRYRHQNGAMRAPPAQSSAQTRLANAAAYMVWPSTGR